jgi:hypothetical protein
MTKNSLTQSELIRQLHYDQNTGKFTRLISNANSVKVGEFAGNINKVSGYVLLWVCGNLYSAHRLAFLYMTGTFPNNDIDHINGIRSDNRWLNLREATRSQNMKNTAKYKTNSSGYKGVSYVKSSNKWLAQACLNRKNFKLGYFDTPEEAKATYDSFCKANHGEFNVTKRNSKMLGVD